MPAPTKVIVARISFVLIKSIYHANRKLQTASGLFIWGAKHLRSPQNQNLSKMREVLKYGIFDISSMSTKGFWLTYVKTSFFVYFWDKNAIFLQISFVPYLTSACPARRLYRTANWSAQ